MFRKHPSVLGKRLHAQDDEGAKRPLQTCVANLVLMVHLNAKLAMVDMVRKRYYHEYVPRRFASAVAHYEPHTTSLISSMGNCVVTGARDMYEALTVALKIAKELQCDYPNAHISDLRLQNFTCTASAGHKVDLPSAARENPDLVIYKPTKFPGANVVTGVARCKAILFSSGEFVLTGAKNLPQAQQALMAIAWLLHKYRLPDDAVIPPMPRGRRKVSIELVVAQIVDAEIKELAQQLMDEDDSDDENHTS